MWLLIILLVLAIIAFFIIVELISWLVGLLIGLIIPDYGPITHVPPKGYKVPKKKWFKRSD